jgi:hypothetical protein
MDQLIKQMVSNNWEFGYVVQEEDLERENQMVENNEEVHRQIRMIEEESNSIFIKEA